MLILHPNKSTKKAEPQLESEECGCSPSQSCCLQLCRLTLLTSELSVRREEEEGGKRAGGGRSRRRERGGEEQEHGSVRGSSYTRAGPTPHFPPPRAVLQTFGFSFKDYFAGSERSGFTRLCRCWFCVGDEPWSRAGGRSLSHRIPAAAPPAWAEQHDPGPSVTASGAGPPLFLWDQACRMLSPLVPYSLLKMHWSPEHAAPLSQWPEQHLDVSSTTSPPSAHKHDPYSSAARRGVFPPAGYPWASDDISALTPPRY
ncbi:hypothetical protein WMY93_003719 [Mugilogobius chulae]|uniref:Uncharacterized protein n=1 Tax=Mugilogobius chulae TaxID=88201 RepID=A0AAW0PZ39_9GOBI